MVGSILCLSMGGSGIEQMTNSYCNNYWLSQEQGVHVEEGALCTMPISPQIMAKIKKKKNRGFLLRCMPTKRYAFGHKLETEYLVRITIGCWKTNFCEINHFSV